MISVLKAVGAPGSINFFALYCLIGLALLFVWPRSARLGRWWLIVGVAIYLFLALPIVANAIAEGLPGAPAIDTPQAVTAIFLLDGDNVVGRLLKVRRLSADSPSSVIWVLGRPWIIDALVEGGIRRDRIQYDGTASNTRAQIAAVQAVVAKVEPSSSVIVVSRLQMPRVAGLARKAGLRTALVASPLDDEPPRAGVQLFAPGYGALRESRDALYEHAALAYYRWAGWIEPAGRGGSSR